MVGVPRAALAGLLLAAAALAGCSDGGSDPEPPEDGLQATENTGLVRGVVVDASITPVADAAVTLSGPGTEASTTSDAEGRFGFDGLAPGSYFIRASKLGFTATQQSVDVVAGEEDPDVVRVLLERDLTFNPYYVVQVYEGFIECTTMILVVCGIPNLVTGDEITNDRYTPTVYFDEDPAWIQTEMVWESTQPLGEEMYFEMEMLDAGCDTTNGTFIGSTRGPSPIFTAFNQSHLSQWNINPVDCGIYYSAFSGPAELSKNPTDPEGCYEAPGVIRYCSGVGVTLQQDFTWYIHAFYGYTPPEGWQFSRDGDPPQPPQ